MSVNIGVISLLEIQKHNPALLRQDIGKRSAIRDRLTFCHTSCPLSTAEQLPAASILKKKAEMP